MSPSATLLSTVGTVGAGRGCSTRRTCPYRRAVDAERLLCTLLDAFEGRGLVDPVDNSSVSFGPTSTLKQTRSYPQLPDVVLLVYLDRLGMFRCGRVGGPVGVPLDASIPACLVVAKGVRDFDHCGVQFEGHVTLVL